jgi:hypothetical protein
MKQADDDNMFNGMGLPDPGNLEHQQELKIPLLSYKRSSRAGLWLLTLPLVFAFTVLLKYQLGMSSPVLNFIESFFAYVNGNRVLTYLIPIIFTGLPLLAMIINLLAICHFAALKEKKELLVTIKCRWLNIAIFLSSFAVLVYFLLPDNMP